MQRRPHAFTLVELLVVIGIIAVLIGVLLPTLATARQSANAVKCAANLRSVGQGLLLYVSENKGTFPAAYIYVGHQIINNGTDQLPHDPVNGYIHWSSYLYKKSAASNANIYADPAGWDAFRCPSLENGGLPPTDTFPANLDGGQQSQYGSIVDQQAPRIAYTVNEAIMPRNKFVAGVTIDGSNVVSTEHFVRAGIIRNNAATILATEFTPNWKLVSSTTSGDFSTPYCKSHRPVHGFYGGTKGGETLDVPTLGGGGFGRNISTLIYRVDPSQLANDPDAMDGGNTPTHTRLDWVGRNHGKKTSVSGYDNRRTNFLYVDGHVETKQVKETLTPRFEWGEKFYSWQFGDAVGVN